MGVTNSFTINRSISGQANPLFSSSKNLCDIPSTLFQHCILSYLECPMEDLSLRTTCKYLQQNMPYPKIVTLVFSQKTINHANALINKYQNEKGGILRVLKVNAANRIGNTYGNWNNWLEGSIPSVKTVYARHFLAESYYKVPSLEELHISCEDLTCYFSLENGLLTFTQLRVLGIFNLGNHKHTENTLIYLSIQLKKLSHIKKLCLLYNLSDKQLYKNLKHTPVENLNKILFGLVESALEEIEITILIGNAEVSQALDFGFLKEEVLQQIAKSTVSVRINGRTLFKSLDASLFNTIKPQDSVKAISTNAIQITLPATPPDVPPPLIPVQQTPPLNAPVNEPTPSNPITTLIPDAVENDRSVSAPSIPQSGILYYLREFCTAIGNLFVYLMQAFWRICHCS